jgi:hypothetical protein
MGQKYQAFDIKTEVGLCFWQQHKIPCDWSLQTIGIVLCGKLRRYKQYKIFCTSTVLLKRMYFYISMSLLAIFMCICQLQKAHRRINMSICLSTCIILVPTRQIFGKFDVGNCYWNLCRKSKFFFMYILRCQQHYKVTIKLVSSSQTVLGY